jgi:hypothetical protein
VSRPIEYDGRVQRWGRGPHFDDVEALIAQVEHGPAPEPARLRGVEHLDAHTLFGAFRGAHLAMQRCPARGE